MTEEPDRTAVPRARVAVVRCENYDPALVRERLAAGLDLLGGAGAFFAAGERVLVKPNLFAAMRPERAQTTHPMIVRALCEAILATGASVAVGENPVFGFTFHTYRRTGVAAALRGLPVPLLDLRRTAPRVLNTARRQRRFLLPVRLADFDHVVSAPKLKTHVLVGLTGAVKNSYGLVHGRGARKVLHFRYPDPADFAEMLLDLDALVRPRLHVVDAVVGADGNAPRLGRPRAVGLLVLGTDAVAVDFVLARAAGLEPEGVETLKAALRRPGWREPWARIEVLGTPLSEIIPARFEPARPGGVVRMLPGPFRRALIAWSKRRMHGS